MERLVYWNNREKGSALPVAINNDGDVVDLETLCAKLAAYEDTGLDPEEIVKIREDVEDGYLKSTARRYGIPVSRLRELAQADREGRCVVLPAKTVFELTWDAGPGCDMICPVSIDGEGQCDFCDNGKLFVYERPCRQEHIDRIGKDVFLTREEAEAALRREQDG